MKLEGSTMEFSAMEASMDIQERADGLMALSEYVRSVVEMRVPATRIAWLEEQAQKIYEQGLQLMNDHGELLGKRSPDPDADEAEHWRLITEYVLQAREHAGRTHLIVFDYVVQLRYPTGPKGWWNALLRGLGLRKGIDRSKSE